MFLTAFISSFILLTLCFNALVCLLKGDEMYKNVVSFLHKIDDYTWKFQFHVVCDNQNSDPENRNF
jgi:hypothetical protein